MLLFLTSSPLLLSIYLPSLPKKRTISRPCMAGAACGRLTWIPPRSDFRQYKQRRRVIQERSAQRGFLCGGNYREGNSFQSSVCTVYLRRRWAYFPPLAYADEAAHTSCPWTVERRWPPAPRHPGAALPWLASVDNKINSFPSIRAA